MLGLFSATSAQPVTRLYLWNPTTLGAFEHLHQEKAKSRELCRESRESSLARETGFVSLEYSRALHSTIH